MTVIFIWPEFTVSVNQFSLVVRPKHDRQTFCIELSYDNKYKELCAFPDEQTAKKFKNFIDARIRYNAEKYGIRNLAQDTI